MAASQVSIPRDEPAEEALVGIVVGSPQRAHEIASRVAPENFYVPAHRRVLEVACQLEHLAGEDARLETISRLAGVPRRDLARLVDERPCAGDSSGALSRRVVAAGCRRRAMALAGEIYNGAAVESLAELRDLAGELLAELEAAEAHGDMGGAL